MMGRSGAIISNGFPSYPDCGWATTRNYRIIWSDEDGAYMIGEPDTDDPWGVVDYLETNLELISPEDDVFDQREKLYEKWRESLENIPAEVAF